MKTETEVKPENNSGFFLSFGDDPVQEKPKPITSEQVPHQQETAEAIKVEKLKKEKKKKEKIKEDDDTPLPNRILKRLEKRKRKKAELRANQKVMKVQQKIDFEKQNDSEIAQIYSKLYPERSLESLQEYARYQRLVFNAKNKRSKRS